MDFRDVISGDVTVIELIEDALARVVAQDGVAYEPGVGCVYRASNGCRCIAGHMIPDDVFFGDLEGKSIVDAYQLTRMPPIPIKDIGIAWSAQSAHDRNVRSYLRHGSIKRFRDELTQEIQGLIGQFISHEGSLS